MRKNILLFRTVAEVFNSFKQDEHSPLKNLDFFLHLSFFNQLSVKKKKKVKCFTACVVRKSHNVWKFNCNNQCFLAWRTSRCPVLSQLPDDSQLRCCFHLRTSFSAWRTEWGREVDTCPERWMFVVINSRSLLNIQGRMCQSLGQDLYSFSASVSPYITYYSKKRARVLRKTENIKTGWSDLNDK